MHETKKNCESEIVRTDRETMRKVVDTEALPTVSQDANSRTDFEKCLL